MKLARAVKLNVGPVIPGAAACIVWVSDKVMANMVKESNRVPEAFVVFINRMAALLLDVDLGHQSTKVLGVVRQVIEICGVEVKSLASLVSRGVQDHVDGLTTPQSDRVSHVIEIVSSCVAQ